MQCIFANTYKFSEEPLPYFGLKIKAGSTCLPNYETSPLKNALFITPLHYAQPAKPS